jgi:hypothetical protein
MTKQPTGDRPQSVYQALQHPVRREILQYMSELDEPMSAVDYVHQRGVDGKTTENAISYISYHLRQLQAADTVELFTTEPRRGATKHLFRISKRFATVYGDILALNRIAALLASGEHAEAAEGMLGEIIEIVRSTGREIRS